MEGKRKLKSKHIDASEQCYVPKIHKKTQKSYNRWTIDENRKYLEFLQKELDSFQEQYERRTKKVFKRLAQFVGTRDHSQCKSHHQKLIKLYTSPEKVVQGLISRMRVENNKKQVIMYFEQKEETKSCTENPDSIFEGSPIGPFFEESIFDVLDLSSDNHFHN